MGPVHTQQHDEFGKLRLRKTIYKFVNLQCYLPIRVLRNVYLAIIQSIIQYGIIVWGFTKQYYSSAACRRISTNSQVTTDQGYVSEYFLRLSWLRLQDRRLVHFLCLLYRIIHDSTPNYLASRFPLLASHYNRNTRSQLNLLLSIPRHQTSLFSSSFSIAMARSWNSLPLEIRLHKLRYRYFVMGSLKIRVDRILVSFNGGGNAIIIMIVVTMITDNNGCVDGDNGYYDFGIGNNGGNGDNDDYGVDNDGSNSVVMVVIAID
ncbi:hypothetical protein ANN_20070 [Periplaneta americana]|uniref:Uncharacterized protein n=1 Tax=Periplaneta americana TaxID=6978 RepID=A0ABQ8SBL7_PERAM|nr:hypothetical protein ANN_20070 [Periplaneta americana]